MSEDWFKEYIQKHNEARAMWKTQPAHRKVCLEQLHRRAVLAYGCECLVENMGDRR